MDKESHKVSPKASVALAMLALARRSESDYYEREYWKSVFSGSGLEREPAKWDKKIRAGGTFSTVPSDVESIRKKLGINKNHSVLIIPVYTGQWSNIHPNAVGADFSEVALAHHTNDRRALADARELPFKTAEFDHVVSYELTPLNTDLSDPVSALKALKELIRVGKKLHIIQRMHRKNLVWTEPIVTRYLKELGVPHKIVDLTDHVTPQYFFYDPRHDRIVSLSIDAQVAHQKIEKMERDIKVLEQATKHFQRGEIYRGTEELVRNGSIALQRAFFEQYFLKKIYPSTARRMKTPFTHRPAGKRP